MVVIRLSRGGAKKRPFYSIVVADSRKPRDGRYIKRLGFYNPIAKGGEQGLVVDLEQVEYWLNNGAQPSDRVSSLLKQYKEQAANSGASSEAGNAKESRKKAAAKKEPQVAAEETESAE